MAGGYKTRRGRFMTAIQSEQSTALRRTLWKIIAMRKVSNTRMQGLRGCKMKQRSPEAHESEAPLVCEPKARLMKAADRFLA